MKITTRKILKQLPEKYPSFTQSLPNVIRAVEEMIVSYAGGGKLLVCGNGGSAADALHIVGELMKAFVLPRYIPEQERLALKDTSVFGDYLGNNLQGALPAISLVNEVSLQTAYSNDMAPDLVFAQQVYGYGNRGDILLAISTSGNSANVIYACEVAHMKGMKVIGLTGNSGGGLKDLCDIIIAVPETETYRVQELHMPIYHAICLALESEFFGVVD